VCHVSTDTNTLSSPATTINYQTKKTRSQGRRVPDAWVYGLTGQAQSFGGGYDLNTLTVPCQGAVFKPARAYVNDGIAPGPLVLREVPTVTIEARFVDSKNRPARRSFVLLFGQIPAINIQPVQQEAIFEEEGLAASINGTEREDKNGELINWQTYTVPDAAGRIVLRAPKGLQNAQIVSMPINEAFSTGNRIGEGKPLTFLASGQLEELKADIRGVTFVLYDAPMIMATVTTEDGERPAVNVQVNASFFSDGNECDHGHQGERAVVAAGNPPRSRGRLDFARVRRRRSPRDVLDRAGRQIGRQGAGG
jgi:hypothetical protein